MQASFWDVAPERSAEVCVYHDESGSDPRHSRFLLQGALFVREPGGSTHLRAWPQLAVATLEGCIS